MPNLEKSCLAGGTSPSSLSINTLAIHTPASTSPNTPAHNNNQPPDMQRHQQQQHLHHNKQKICMRNIKSQAKRFRVETKAAKTLAIIVGLFVLCWLPFFTMYLVRGFCVKCIHPLLFSVLFWLGYCNSAVNPLIYALFSRDFRHAFKYLLCRVVCRRTGSGSGSGVGKGSSGGRGGAHQLSTSSRRGSDMSQFRTDCSGGGGGSSLTVGGGYSGARTPSITPSVLDTYAIAEDLPAHLRHASSARDALLPPKTAIR